MYDGTLHANWQALVTLQQLVILAERDGTIDMSVSAISGRTGIPIDVIESGITKLAQPDPYSRTPDEDGRRIVPLDDRPWGWRIVNYLKYRGIRNLDDRREQNRQAQQRRRDSQPQVSQSQPESALVSPGKMEEVEGSASTVLPVLASQVLPEPPKLARSVSRRPREISAPPDPSGFLIPTNRKGLELDLSKRLIAEWEANYPAVDVPQTLREIRAWCISNPSNCKTPNGIPRFINRWLQKEQNGGPNGPQGFAGQHPRKVR